MELNKIQIRMIALLFSIMFFCSASVSAEQVWFTNKSNKCRFSIPIHSPDIKVTDISWEGLCKDNLANGEGVLAVKFYILPKDKVPLTLDGTVTMQNGQLHGKASVRWNYGASFEGEYTNGERTKGLLSFDGESFDGEFFMDVFQGKGTMRYKNGDVYEGNWVKGLRSGSGTLTGPDGKVKYQGEWINNYPANDPAANRVLKGFLTIPWGSSREETDRAMKARPGNFRTSFWYQGSLYWGFAKDKSADVYYTYILGKFNNETAYLYTYYNENKLFMGRVVLFNSEQEIMGKFDTVKTDLTARYGAPTREVGKFLDTEVVWEFQDRNFISLKINRFGYEKNNYAAFPDIGNDMKQPFNLTIAYAQGTVFSKIYSTNAITNKTDY